MKDYPPIMTDVSVAQTRLRPPLIGDGLVSRPRLVQKIQHALVEQHLILVSAPAGYGKTVLLAEAAETGLDVRWAWVSLDGADRDPYQLLNVLVAALRRVGPSFGARIGALLDARSAWTPSRDPRVDVERLMAVLINDVIESLPDPFVLVLDDLHRIVEPSIFAALDYLLERMPPHMRLLIATRHDPPLALARLRVHGHLAELRADDLRFTLHETTAFLNDRWGLGLSAPDLEILRDHTEGWPAGLRLVAGSLVAAGADIGRRELIQAFQRAEKPVFDYLAEEVLRGEEPAVRVFLLETSILGELVPEVCRAVTGRDDAVAILEDLRRRNLFVVATHPSHSSYRYHDLFAEFLRDRLREERPHRVRELHLAAAAAQRSPEHAIPHYLAAEEWDQASSLIERIAPRLLQEGRLDSLRTWVESTPVAVRDRHPRLLYVSGVCASRSNDFQAARHVLERARDATDDVMLRGEVLAELTTCSFLQRDLERFHAVIAQAADHPMPPHARVQVLLQRLGLSCLAEGGAQATTDFDECLALASASGEPGALRQLIMDLPPFFLGVPGGLARMEQLCRLVARHVGDDTGPARVAVEANVALTDLHRGRLDRALGHAMSALALSERLGHLVLLDSVAMSVLLLVHAIRREDEAVEPLMDGYVRFDGQVPLFDVIRSAPLYLVGRIRCLQGRLQEAREIYALMCATDVDRELPFSRPMRPLMRGLLEMSDRRYRAAQASFREAEALARRAPQTRMYSSPRLLLAVLHLRQNRPSQALAELAPILREYEREGAVGFLLFEGATVVPLLRLAVERDIHAAFAKAVLDRFPRSVSAGAPPRIPHTGEQITPRELEVIRLVAAGASNEEIARRLVITQHTAKTHLYRVYRKLDVKSRTEAAARARDLGII